MALIYPIVQEQFAIFSTGLKFFAPSSEANVTDETVEATTPTAFITNRESEERSDLKFLSKRLSAPESDDFPCRADEVVRDFFWIRPFNDGVYRDELIPN